MKWILETAVHINNKYLNISCDILELNLSTINTLNAKLQRIQTPNTAKI